MKNIGLLLAIGAGLYFLSRSSFAGGGGYEPTQNKTGIPGQRPIVPGTANRNNARYNPNTNRSRR